LRGFEPEAGGEALPKTEILKKEAFPKLQFLGKQA
jgi:hypothetical protein